MGYATAAEERFMREFLSREPKARNGGIAPGDPNQGGYHNSRNKLYSIGKTNDYSVRLSWDKAGDGDAYCAVDIVFVDAQNGDYTTIRKYMNRIKAAFDRNDSRLAFFREFLGQQDADGNPEGFDIPNHSTRTPDMSHMWHIHISILRQYAALWAAWQELLDVLFDVNPVGEEDMDSDQNRRLVNVDEHFLHSTLKGDKTVKYRVGTGNAPSDFVEMPNYVNRTLDSIKADVATLVAAQQSPVPVTVDASAVAEALRNDAEFINVLAKAVADEDHRRSAE